MKILTINNRKEKKFLRKKTAKFDFSTRSTSSGQEFTKKEIDDLIKQMREIMTEAMGIGLSANQLGLNLRLFVAQIPDEPLKRDKNNKIILPPPESMKFYAIFNPEIIKFSKEKKEKIVMEEGCLSAPGIYGEVERPEKITLVGYDKNAKKIKIKAWGLLARVFQHEVDHLNGILFIDRCKKVLPLGNPKS
jgi:peptide deformylase